MSVLVVPGTVGEFVSTPDLNLLNSDTAHLHQAAGTWVGYNGGTATLSTAIASPIAGAAHVLEVVMPDTKGAVFTAPVGAATEYTISVDVYSLTPLTFLFDAISHDAGFGFLAYHGVGARSHTGSGWERFALTFTSDAAAVNMGAYLYQTSPTTDVGDTVYAAKAMLAVGTLETFARSYRMRSNIDLSCKVAATDWTTGAPQVIFDTLESVSHIGCQMGITATGEPFAYYGDGSSNRLTLASGFSLTDGVASTLRVTVDVSTGDVFWYQDDVQVDTGSIATGPGAGIVGDVLMIGGGAPAPGGQMFAGDIYWVELRDGIDGPLVASMQPDDYVIGP